MLPVRDSQYDDVGLERVLQGLGKDRRADRVCLRRERFRLMAACYSHFDALAGEHAGQRLADRAETYDCVAHVTFPIGVEVGYPGMIQA